MKKLMITLMMAGTMIGHAYADNTPRFGEAGFLRSPGGASFVVISKDKDSLLKSIALAKAGAESQAFVPYIACIVPNETKAISEAPSLYSAFADSDLCYITVINGQNAGCIGVVTRDTLQK